MQRRECMAKDGKKAEKPKRAKKIDWEGMYPEGFISHFGIRHMP